jgi:peptidoglycan/LPS O-acetylase OafA/YrhL
MALPTGLITLWFIAHVTAGVRGWMGRLLSLPPSVYLGRISYGIYIYHFWMPGLMKPMLARIDGRQRSPAFLLLCLAATIVAATLSWFLLERPINSLKNHFRVVRSEGQS